MLNNSLKKQRGVVIVVALFFVGLVAALSYYMMSRLERDTRRTQLISRYVQAELLAQGSIEWAMEQLRFNFENQKTNTLVDIMPLTSPADVVNGYKIYSSITDVQSKLNINNLMTFEFQADFKRLLKLVDKDITEQKINEMTMNVVDWIIPGQQQNELNKYYLSLSPAYRAAHRPMMSVSELQLVKGMTPTLYQALHDYVTALPSSSIPINVQTAPAVVLASLSDNMTIATGLEIEKRRKQQPILSIQEFLNLDLIKNHPIPSSQISVVSSYFLIETVVEIEMQRILLYTLVERLSNQRKSYIRVVWQSKSSMEQ